MVLLASRRNQKLPDNNNNHNDNDNVDDSDDYGDGGDDGDGTPRFTLCLPIAGTDPGAFGV